MCKERHLTTLHGLKVEKGNTSDKDKHEYNQNSEQDEKDTPSVKTFQCNSTYAGSDVVSLCVISIRVSHKQSIIAINTYVLFNSFSQGTFVTDEPERKRYHHYSENTEWRSYRKFKGNRRIESFQLI